MRMIETLIEKYCPNGVEYKQVGDVFHVQNGYTPSKSDKSFWENGTIPWIRLEDIRKNGRVLNDAIQHITPSAVKKGGPFRAGSILITTTATIGEYALIECDFICNQQITCLTPKSKETNPHFYLHYAAILGEWCKQNVNGAGLSILPTSKLKECLIPVPPLPVQEEIVRILDTFTELQAELQAELERRRQQYTFVCDQYFDFENGCPAVQIREIAKQERIRNKNHLSENAYSITQRGLIPTADYFGEKTQITSSDTSNYLLVYRNWFVYSPSRIDVGSVDYMKDDGPVIVSPLDVVFSIDESKVIPQYLQYYLLSSRGQFEILKYRQGIEGTGRKLLPFTEFSKALIPLPSISEQNKIVSIIDKFYSLAYDLTVGLPAEIEKRKQQYEYYRDRLLTFKRKEA